jgi:hypothetical protein
MTTNEPPVVLVVDDDDVLQEHYALAETLATIEDQKSETTLASNESYQDLRDRFADLDARLSERAADLDQTDIVHSITSVSATVGPDDQTESESDDS